MLSYQLRQIERQKQRYYRRASKPTDVILSRKEAAEILYRVPGTLRKWEKKNYGPKYHPEYKGYLKSEVESFLESLL